MNKTVETEKDQITLTWLEGIQSKALLHADKARHPLWKHALMDLASAASHIRGLEARCTEEQRTSEQEAGSVVERGTAKWRAIQEAG